MPEQEPVEEDEYRVNVWFKSEADVDVTATSEEEAIEKAKEAVQNGAAVTTSPTHDEFLSANARKSNTRL